LSLGLLKRKVQSLERKDAKRARLTTHKNHLPLQGVLVMKDTVSLYLPSQVSGLFKIILAFTLSCCTRGLFSQSHDCID